MTNEGVFIKSTSYLKMGYGKIKSLFGKYTILAGKLTEDGEVVNNAPDSDTTSDASFTLVANTDGQNVMTVENRKYKRLLIYIEQAATVTSYDWKLQVIYGSPINDVSTLETTTGTATWLENAITDTAGRGYMGDVPYGENISLRLVGDNNHATTDITLKVQMTLFDPVR